MIFSSLHFQLCPHSAAIFWHENHYPLALQDIWGKNTKQNFFLIKVALHQKKLDKNKKIHIYTVAASVILVWKLHLDCWEKKHWFEYSNSYGWTLFMNDWINGQKYVVKLWVLEPNRGLGTRRVRFDRWLGLYYILNLIRVRLKLGEVETFLVILKWSAFLEKH